jgi:hypothetical protein
MAEGGDTGVISLKAIVPHLTCTFCSEVLTTATTATGMCESGHTFCSFCLSHLDNCTRCKGKFLENARNYSIEQITDTVKYKCRNFLFGCKTLLTKDLLTIHDITCPHSSAVCPLEKIPEVRCEWIGSLSQLLDHVKTKHRDRITSRNYFSCKSLKATHWLTIYNGELFLYYKHIKDGQWHACVQTAGLTGALFKSVFILRSHDESNNEAIEMSFAVDLITTFEQLYRYGRCLLLDDIVVKRFVRSNQMNMVVSIEEIRRR